ncbi:MAG: ABC transporter ATP-binding protein [Bacteroidota bacterium]|uniref:ABC-type multidrug transport system, ATPase component n=1 Tax=Algoriphagus faecimaris TaxID=686796 RepID=A0A1G6SHE9_9BACT|nr:ATP-binding cassette domain-containing protein [Algoriphagus faecimaris]SDD16268.1 ABC-type multidrug transport system, ATPase component [Algoriphagus faecimaris]
MLKISLEGASKRFQYEWIFKNLSLEISSGTAMAVTGSNGSGKSTLLKCLAGAIPLSQGKISYHIDDQLIPESDWFKNITISAPYMELPEELNLQELIQFHFKFKRPKKGIQIESIPEILYLEAHKTKQVALFSSGMKQRLKLGLALFSQSNVVYLDEPTSNLDKKGIAWYLEMVGTYSKNQILIICSNEPREFEFCEKKIVLEDYK